MYCKNLLKHSAIFKHSSCLFKKKNTPETNQNIHMNNKTDLVGWYSQIPQITSNNV